MTYDELRRQMDVLDVGWREVAQAIGVARAIPLQMWRGLEDEFRENPDRVRAALYWLGYERYKAIGRVLLDLGPAAERHERAA